MFSTTFLKRWFHGSRKPAARSHFRPKAKPALETLEERWCPALAVDIFDMNGLGNSPTTAVKAAKVTPSDGVVFFDCANLTIDSANDVDYYAIRFEGTGVPGTFFQINFTNANGDLDLELDKVNND